MIQLILFFIVSELDSTPFNIYGSQSVSRRGKIRVDTQEHSSTTLASIAHILFNEIHMYLALKRNLLFLQAFKMHHQVIRFLGHLVA